jgi:uncharacterized protein (TIGR02145 family)
LYWVLDYLSGNLGQINQDVPTGLSVRCLKDAPETGSINSLDCGGAVNTGTIYAGQAALGASTTINYSGGNGGSYSSQVITSSGVTGLTATLSAGNVADGDGSLSFSISGTPASTGTASFALNIGGQSCILIRLVVATGGGVTDIDGNTYGSVIIGNQEWMSENLKVSKYRNGDLIPTNLSNSSWASTIAGAFAINNNDTANNSAFGKLYNWYAVADNRGLCPTNWHVPSESEWLSLEIFLDATINNPPNGTGWHGTDVGGKLKEVSSIWDSPNFGATNSSGFSALPGGFRSVNGTYLRTGGIGFWWNSTQSGPTTAWSRQLSYNRSDAAWGGGAFKTYGHSVRCLKD